MKTNNKIYCIIAIMLVLISILSIKSYASNETTLTYKNLVGEDRYDTSILTSKEAYPNGAKNVILVNGSTNTDGILAVPLAQKISAPILLTNKDRLRENLSTEIKRLKATKIYLIGGTSVISESVEKELEKMNLIVERIYGSNRYSTSIEVAKKMETFDKVIICNSKDNGKNASAIATVAAQNGIPILYNDSQNELNSTIYKYIKGKAKNIYVIGNGMSKSQKVLFRMKRVNVIEIKGDTTYKVNTEIVKLFNKSYDKVVLVNNTIDVVSVSYLAAKNNALLLCTGTNLTQEQKQLLKNNGTISEIYYSGGGKIKGTVKEVINLLENKEQKTKVVFYVPHQDDETLYFGQTILKAIKEKGAENVYVVMISDGASSNVSKKANVQKTLKEKGITFSKARDNEFLAACKALGLKESNILFNENIGLNRLKDGKLNSDSIKETMLYFENRFSGDIIHITYTFEYDYNLDHLECGKALNELYYDLDLKEDSFTNVYYIIRRNYEIENANSKQILTLKEINNSDKLLKAIDKYKESNDSKNKNEIRIGIGYMSVKKEFEDVKKAIEDKTLITNMHLPY